MSITPTKATSTIPFVRKRCYQRFIDVEAAKHIKRAVDRGEPGTGIRLRGGDELINEAHLMATWHDVRRIALALPGTSEETSRDHTAWIVNKKFFVWERPLRKSDLAALGDGAPGGPILGVRTADLEMKEVLLLSDPKVFFTTPHFDGYPAVLVQLDKIGAKKLRDVIEEAWLARAAKRDVAAFLQKRK